MQALAADRSQNSKCLALPLPNGTTTTSGQPQSGPICHLEHPPPNLIVELLGPCVDYFSRWPPPVRPPRRRKLSQLAPAACIWWQQRTTRHHFRISWNLRFTSTFLQNCTYIYISLSTRESKCAVRERHSFNPLLLGPHHHQALPRHSPHRVWYHKTSLSLSPSIHPSIVNFFFLLLRESISSWVLATSPQSIHPSIHSSRHPIRSNQSWSLWSVAPLLATQFQRTTTTTGSPPAPVLYYVHT